MKNNNYRLLMVGLPEIKSLDDFSDKTHLSKGLLYKLWKITPYFYRTFTILKKSGSKRVIDSPNETLKAVQGWILNNILNHIVVSEHAKAYVKKLNITDNVAPHIGNKFLFCIDLEEFFTSIKYNKIFTVFNSVGYSEHISHILTSICTYKGYLPQGAVTSPVLSNIVCIKLDKRLSSLAGQKNVTYTRYADDITFSGMNPNIFRSLLNIVEKILKEEDFKINNKKTRFIGPDRSRTITGLTLSENSFGISRKRKRILRAAIYNLKNSIEPLEKQKHHVDGWLNYMKSVDNKGYQQLFAYNKKVTRKHK